MKNQLIVIKYYAYKLRKNHQLPYQLVYYIDLLNKDSDVNLIKLLSGLTEHYIRVKGYYKKYPLIEKDCNKEIANAFVTYMDRKGEDK